MLNIKLHNRKRKIRFFPHFKEKFQNHKKNFKIKISNFKEKIKFHHHRIKLHIQNLISHKYFYPITVSVICLAEIAIIWTYANQEIVNIYNTKNYLEQYCQNTYNPIIIHCWKYQKLKLKLDKIIDKFFVKMQKKYSNSYKTKLFGLIKTLSNLDVSKYNERQIFAIQYLDLKIKNEIAKTNSKLIITNQWTYWYWYWYYLNKQILKWTNWLIQSFSIKNLSKYNIYVKNLIFQLYQWWNDFAQANDLNSLKVKVFWNNWFKKTCEAKINNTSWKIISICNMYFQPNYEYTIQIHWKISKTTNKNKILIMFDPTQTSFEESNNILKNNEIIYIKNFEYAKIK